MYNKTNGFPSRFVVWLSIALQHSSALQILYLLSQLFASTIAAPCTIYTPSRHPLKKIILGQHLAHGETSDLFIRAGYLSSSDPFMPCKKSRETSIAEQASLSNVLIICNNVDSHAGLSL